MLGHAHLARRDGTAAADAFARALQADMTDGETHYNLGVALQMRRHYAEAARAYQRALLFRPEFQAAHFNLGVLFQEQRMTDAAITAYREVLAADPGNVAAYRNLGEVLLSSGRIDAYLENFRRFEARCPDAMPLAVQALVACQHQGTSQASTVISRGCATSGSRREAKRSSPMRSRSFSTCCTSSTSSPRSCSISRRRTTMSCAGRSAIRSRRHDRAGRGACASATCPAICATT